MDKPKPIGLSLRMLLVVAAFLAAISLAPEAHAASIQPTRLSLPNGPASIEGLGRNFTPSLASGTASYGIDVAVPPAIAGFGPSLSLDYDSGGGVSEVGLGWRLGGLPSLRRRTEDGLPKFDASDKFELTGLGAPSVLLEVSPGVFRPVQESGAFLRVRRSDDGTKWETRDKSGVTYRFGGEGCTESEGGNTATYLLSEQLDLHSHRIQYAWDTSKGHALLQSVTWNAQTPESTLVIKLTYDARPDVQERYSSGIRQIIDRRLSRIDVTRGAAIVRSYTLSYNVAATGQSSAAGDNRSLLTRVHVTGTDGVTALPDLTFEYTGIRLIGTGAGSVIAMTTPPGRSPGEANVSLADLNGDSLPDLLVAQAEQYRSYVNRDGQSWDSGVNWESNSPSLSLGDIGVQLADIDGNGAVDLVAKSGTSSFRYFPVVDDQHVGRAVTITTVPNFTFEDPNVRLADMDGDRRTDVVVTTPTGLAIGYNLNGKDWTVPATVGIVDPTQALMFDDGHTQLCDVNGDRIQDICYLRSGSLAYYLGRGRGRFEAARVTTGVPQFDVSSPYRPIDLNGDGWVDLVRVGVSQVDYAIATGAGAFSITGSITDVPTKASSTTIELADMNGSGTTDIVWIDVSGGPATAWQYLELFPDGRAGLLKTIDNGLGKVTRITYAPAALGAAKSREERSPWAARLNVGIPVVSEVRAQSALGDPDIVTRFDYRNGAWDAVERTFAGFGRGIQTDVGDESTPTLMTDSTFDQGLVTRVLRGQTLTVELRDAARKIFTKTTNGYVSSDLDTTADGARVKYAYKSSERVEHLEGQETGKTTLTEWTQDRFGNVIREARWGIVDGDDKLAGNDEAITLSTYANNERDWILGRIASEELLDAQGKRISLRRSYYDGAAFVGLPLGAVDRGDLRRVESWIECEHLSDEFRAEHDKDGNVIVAIDGKGSQTELTYDSSHQFLIREVRHVDAATALTWNATYDALFGVVTWFQEPNGHETSVNYDALGRVTSIIKPGDSLERPTLSFEYTVAVPLSTVKTHVRERSGADGTLDKVVLVDGFGRSSTTFSEGSEAGTWILSGFSLFDARGNAAFTAHATEVASLSLPVATTLSGTKTLRDALGRVTTMIHPDGAQARTEYGPLYESFADENDSDQASPHYGTPTTRIHDGLGRLVSVIERDAGREITSATYSYDGLGSLLTITDALGRVRHYAYDGRGRRTRIEDPNAGIWSMTYTDGNDLETRSGPDGSVVSFAFDSFGRVLEEWHQTPTQPAHIVTRFHYDAPSSKHPELGNALGQLAWVEDQAGTKYFGYDERGRQNDAIRRWADGTEHHDWSDYDAQDRVVRRGFPNNTHLSLDYNSRGLVSQIGPLAKNFQWTPHGGLSSVTLGNGITDGHAYDQRQRLTSMSATAVNGTLLRGFTLTLDAASHVTAISDLRPNIAPSESLTATYSYDDRYRLRKASYVAGETTWELDDLAKVTKVVSTFDDPHLNVSATYGDAEGPDRLANHGSEAIEYDAAGRVVRDGERTLTWDAKGRLAKVTRLGATEEYVYGHDDRRAIKKTTAVDGAVTITRYVADDIEERDGQLVRYAFLGKQRLARLDPVDVGPRTAPVTSVASVVDQTGPRTATRAWPITVRLAWSALAAAVVLLAGAIARLAARGVRMGWAHSGALALAVATLVFGACGGGTRMLSSLEQLRAESKEIAAVPVGAEFYLSDAQSSPLVVAAASGMVSSRSVYHAYGQVRNQTGIHTDPFSYVGNEEDRGSGLSDFGARPYRPELGVFLSVDPLALFEPEKTIGIPARLFAYAYAGGDPINNADPSGLTFGEYLQGIGAGAVDLVKGAAATAVQTAKSDIALLSEGRLADFAKAAIIDRAPIVVAVKGVAETVRSVATFGDDFAKAAFAASDYESGRLAVKPVLTAMTITATVLGATGAGKQLTGRGASSKAPAGGGGTTCAGGKCGGPGVCFVAGTLVATSAGFVPIEQLRPGDRVDASNPACDADRLPRGTKAISLQMPNPAAPEDLLHIELLRPMEWLASVGLRAEGERTWLDLEEVGVSGWATVTRIAEHPVVSQGTGCLVLMTVQHVASELLRVHVEDSPEAFELTPVHRLFVEGRGWTEAQELVDGDKLRTDTGPVNIASIEGVAGGRTVYNIEVAREHAYRVSTKRAWTHNQCGKSSVVGPGTLTQKEAAQIQQLSNKYNTQIDVVGSRAAGRGRNIETSLPVDKGEGTRSDIDFRYDGQVEINFGGRFTEELRGVGQGAGAPSFATGPGGSRPPVIEFRPGQPAVWRKE